MKKLMALFVLATYMLSMMSTTASAQTFLDVKEDSELEMVAELLVNTGIMNSYCSCWFGK